MNEEAEFADHIEMQEYAERNGLDYAWSGTALFAKRARTLPPDQFEMRAVRTRRGITMVGLFSAQSGRLTRLIERPWLRNGWPEKHGPRGVWHVDGAPKIGSRNGYRRLPLCQGRWP